MWLLCFSILGPICFIEAILNNTINYTQFNITVTTAKPIAPSSARPTTLMRIIQVRQEDFDHKNATDLVKEPPLVQQLQSRRSRKVDKKVWIWDSWCLLQPKTGDCGLNYTKYYYNTQLDLCMTFPWTGCEDRKRSNKNRFDCVSDCERRCKGAIVMPASNPKSHVCELQPNSGQCLGSNEMYYYDVNESACKIFVFSGCGGNFNKFESEEECMEFCGKYGQDMSSDEFIDDDDDKRK